MARRVERLLERFLAEEAGRETGGFEPWLLEAGFGDHEDAERPALELDGWGLHGAIDRVDRAPDGRALVIDYKLSGSVTPREKFEEQAKLQLPLYLLAVERALGRGAVGGLYHPLRGTSVRRPRGVVAEEAARTSPTTASTAATWSTPRAWRSCWRTRGGGPARSSPACAPATSAATPAPAAACATTTPARPSATSRRSAAATAPPSSRRTRTWRSDERRALLRPSRRRRSRSAASTSCSRPAPAPARPG